MKIVGKFKLNDIVYGIGIKDNKYFVGRIKDDKLYTFLTDEEKNVVNLILDRLTPGSDLVEVTPVMIEDRIYKTYYNPSKSMFLFNPKPNESDLKFLNSTYNNQSEYLFNNNVNQTNNYFKRLVKLGKKTVVVILSSAFLLGNAQVVKADTNASEFNTIQVIHNDELDNSLISEYINEELPKLEVDLLTRYDVQDLVYTAIKNNTNLSIDEKILLLKYSTIVLDNYKYMDLARVLNSLNKLTIHYYSFNFTDSVWQVSLSGTCNSFTNEIKFYNVENFEQVSKKVFAHEVCHLFQPTFKNEYSSFFVEGTNSITVEDYFGTDRSYEDNNKIIRLLGEIIGKDVIKQYYFVGDLNVIKEALLAIIPDQALVDKFISLTHQFDSTSYQEDQHQLINRQMRNILATFYEAKYNRKIEDDLVALYYYNEKEFVKKMDSGEMSQGYDGYVSVEENPHIVNKREKDEKYGFTITYNKIDHYDAIDREDAIEQGIIAQDNGEDILIFTDCYINKLTNKVMVPVVKTFDKKFEFNETNRYLNSTLSR